MLDWKIVVASFAALLFVSSLLLGGLGVGDTFSDILDNIGQWLDSSPFGGFFSVPSKQTSSIDVILYPSELTLNPDAEINLNLDQFELSNFKGGITADFVNNTLVFEEDSSSLKISMPLSNITIEELRINALLIDGMKFIIVPDVTAENCSMEMYDFYGTGLITGEHIELMGNASRVKAKIGNMNWELS